MEARRALFEGLIDYAGLFPPAGLEMQPAAEEYGTLRAGPWSWICGRFVLAASRTFELCEELEDLAGGGTMNPYPLSTIVDAGTDPRAWLANASRALATLVKVAGEGLPVRVEALEVPVPALTAARDTYDPVIGQFGMIAQNAGLRDLPIYIEIPRTQGWAKLLPGAMAALSRAKFGAKIRCGGLTAAAFPSSEEIAAFLRAALEENVPFKATAGLHHPVRRRDPGTGLTMHGFLNILAATMFVRAGALDEEIIEILEERDEKAFLLAPDSFSWRHRSACVHEIQVARKSGFVAYGSCSIGEPVADLVALGMLRAEKAPA